MKCSDPQSNLSLYADGFFDESETVSFRQHLEICPLCRQKDAEYREIRSGLRQMRRPAISAALRNTIKQTVRSEIRVEKQSWLPVSSGRREWLQMRVMPYGVGVFASVLVAVTFLTMMFSGMLRPAPDPLAASRGDSSVMLASDRILFSGADSSVISPSDYAQTRLAFSRESPSINPQGALIAMTKSFIRGGMKDDEVVVVADVFSNGLAKVTEVVEPSHDKLAIVELEKALQSDPAYAPFVPSPIENRPDSVRVVLKFQSVNVSTRQKRGKL